MRPSAHNQKPQDLGIDAEIGHRLVDVKIGVAGLRSVRMGLFQLAYALADRPNSEGFLVLSDVAITRERLEREWQHAASVLRPEMLNRLSLCIEENGHFSGIPRNPDPETERILSDVIALDSGCVWGRELSALRLDDRRIFQCDCRDMAGTAPEQ